MDYTNVKVPSPLYEKLKELAKDEKPLWKVIDECLERVTIGDVQIYLPEPEFIRLRYPAWCVLGNHKIDPTQSNGPITALRLPRLNGVVCIDCLVKSVFTEEKQAKTLAMLEVEIRKLKAIKQQLSKEVSRLVSEYAFHEQMHAIKSMINKLEDAIFTIERVPDVNKNEELSRIRQRLYEILEILRKLEVYRMNG